MFLRLFLLLGFAFTPFTASLQAAVPLKASVILSWQQRVPNPALQIETSFVGSKTGQTVIHGFERLAPVLKDFRILSPATEQISSHPLTLKHPPLQKIRLQYELSSNLADGSSVSRIQTHANGFWLSGRALLGPQISSEQTLFEFTYLLPSGWQVADSHNLRNQRTKFYSSWLALRESAFSAGDIRILEGTDVVLLIRGQWRFEDKDALNLVNTVIRQNNLYWNFPPSPTKPRIWLQPISTSSDWITCCDFQTLTHDRAMVQFRISDTLRLSQPTDRSLFAHSLLVALQLGIFSEGIPAPEAKNHWFGRGFAQYFGNYIALQNGYMTWPAFTQFYNETYARYRFSELRSRSLNELTQIASPDEDWLENKKDHVKHLEDRGYLLAQRFWNRISYSKSPSSLVDLADVIRKLWLLRTSQLELFRTEAATALDLAAREVLPLKLAQTLKEEYLTLFTKGKVLTPKKDELGPCASQETQMMRGVDYGFDLVRSLQTKSITGLKKDSPAASAGLTEGALILKALTPQSLPPRQARFLINKEGVEQEVSFIPSTPTSMMIPQFVPIICEQSKVKE